MVAEGRTESLAHPPHKPLFKIPPASVGSTAVAGPDGDQAADVKPPQLPSIGYFAAEHQRREALGLYDPKHNLRRRSSVSTEHKVSTRLLVAIQVIIFPLNNCFLY